MEFAHYVILVLLFIGIAFVGDNISKITSPDNKDANFCLLSEVSKDGRVVEVYPEISENERQIADTYFSGMDVEIIPNSGEWLAVELSPVDGKTPFAAKCMYEVLITPKKHARYYTALSAKAVTWINLIHLNAWREKIKNGQTN